MDSLEPACHGIHGICMGLRDLGGCDQFGPEEPEAPPGQFLFADDDFEPGGVLHMDLIGLVLQRDRGDVDGLFGHQ